MPPSAGVPGPRNLNLSVHPQETPDFKESETFWNKHKVKIGVGVLVGVVLIVTGLAIPVLAAVAAAAIFTLFTAAVIGTTAGVVGAVVFGIGALALLISLYALKHAIFEKPPGMFDPIEVPFADENVNTVDQEANAVFKARLKLYHPKDRPYVSYSCFKDRNGRINVIEVEEIVKNDRVITTQYRIVAQGSLGARSRFADSKLLVNPNIQWLDQPIPVDEYGDNIESAAIDDDEDDGEEVIDLASPMEVSYNVRKGNEKVEDRAERAFIERLDQYHPQGKPNSRFVCCVNEYGMGTIIEKSGNQQRVVAEFELNTLQTHNGMLLITPKIIWTQIGYEHDIQRRGRRIS